MPTLRFHIHFLLTICHLTSPSTFFYPHRRTQCCHPFSGASQTERVIDDEQAFRSSSTGIAIVSSFTKIVNETSGLKLGGRSHGPRWWHDTVVRRCKDFDNLVQNAQSNQMIDMSATNGFVQFVWSVDFF